MLGDRTVELVKQADKAAKLTEDLANHPAAGLNVVNPLPAASPGLFAQDIQRKAQEIDQDAKTLVFRFMV